ncbi:MAG: AAA family ATPase [Deltaproteobacteria bacterium]|jgi:hypothetical protein|nr:AAA family ATPase [Deltaproteobacteria bacterium]
MTLKELSAAELPFADIIDRGFLYADKTKYIYELLKGPEKDFFLSRPRRFGKSLLISTFIELFTGNRDRFKDLWIDGSDYEFPRHPVIHLSLSIDSRTTENLNADLITKLKWTCENAEISPEEVPGADIFLGNVIRALYRKYNAKIALLIDDYDAPVTRYMDDMKLAQTNANALHNIFAILKDYELNSKIRFSLVAGVAKYALAFMDSGPNHLTDISLNQKYSGICGFTLEEFDSLFSDRLEETLIKLKNSGKMNASATVETLKEEIFKWYDGYNWGGPLRILNPYSILNFFKNNAFSRYWIQSGRPSRPTALIKRRPLDFLQPALKSHIGSNLRAYDLNRLEDVPVLFHDGHLTVDEAAYFPKFNSDDTEERYSFRLPNYEDYSYYFRERFREVLNDRADERLENIADTLKNAMLTRNPDEIDDVFSNFITSLSFYERPRDEKTFHSLIHMILLGMGFDLRSEPPDYRGRLNLHVKLENDVFVIFELKYRPFKVYLSPEEENKLLAALALDRVPSSRLNESVADKAAMKLDTDLVTPILLNYNLGGISKDERDKTLAQAALNSLPDPVIQPILADIARERLPHKEIDLVLSEQANSKIPPARIDYVLTKASNKALSDMRQRDYRAPSRLKAKKIIEIGLSAYGDCARVKTLFGPETAPDSP